MMTKNELKYHLSQNVITMVWTTTLLGGEFDNCHGQGKTVEQAINSLRFAVSWNRRKRLKSGFKENDTYSGSVAK